jgi:hypothetical protein
VKTIGIDWGHHELCIAVFESESSDLSCFYLSAHDLPALLELIAHECGEDLKLIVMEAGKRMLAESLRARGLPVTEVAPNRANAARKAYFPSGAKDDRRDAKALALAAYEAPRMLGNLITFSPRRRQLRLLSQARLRVVHCRVRAIQQLIDVIRGGHPGLAALNLNYTCLYALALAKAYADPLAAARARHQKVARLIRRAGSLDPQRVLECFAQHGHVLDPDCAAAVGEELRMTVERIELLSKQIARYDTLIAEAFAEHPDAQVFASVPGIGPILAPRIAARIDSSSVEKLSSVKAQTLAGTSPRTVASGGRHEGTVLRRNACDRDLHQAMVAMARGSLRTSAWARAFVSQYTGGSHAKARHRFNMAVRALANKWLKIIHALLVRGTTYDERVHLEHLQRAGVPWAKDLELAA